MLNTSKIFLSAIAFMICLGSTLLSQITWGKHFLNGSEEDQFVARQARNQMNAVRAEVGVRLARMAETYLVNRENLDAVVTLCQQAVEHNPALEADIAEMLNDYSQRFFSGNEDPSERNISVAFDLGLAAARYGADAGPHLASYIRTLLLGDDGVDQDIVHATQFYKRAVELNLNHSTMTLIRGEFGSYAGELFNRRKDHKGAIDLLRKLHIIEPGNDPHKVNLATCLFAYSTMAFDGSPDHGVVRNVADATQFCQEAIDLGNKDAMDRLARFSIRLFNGQDVAFDKPLAISLLRKLLSYPDHPENGKVLLGRMLNNYAIELYRECKVEHSKIVDLRQSKNTETAEVLARLKEALDTLTQKLQCGRVVDGSRCIRQFCSTPRSSRAYTIFYSKLLYESSLKLS